MSGQVSKGKRSVGTLLKVLSGSPEAFNTIGDVTNIAVDDPKFDEIDITHLNSPTDAAGNITEEVLYGILRMGSITIDLNFSGADEQDTLIGAAGTALDFEMHFPQLTDYAATGLKISFTALVGFVLPKPDLKGAVKATVRLRVTGPYEFAAIGA